MRKFFDEGESYDIELAEQEKVDIVLQGISSDQHYAHMVMNFQMARANEDRRPGRPKTVEDVTLQDMERTFNNFDRSTSSGLRGIKKQVLSKDKAPYRRFTPRSNDHYTTASVHVSDKKTQEKKRDIKCFHCGGNHRIGVCPKATPEQKKAAWDKFYKQNENAATNLVYTKTNHPNKTTTIRQKPHKSVQFSTEDEANEVEENDSD